ncbi:(2Fe-2S)-binding protein [Amphibiibacter pelophylacis]|uniref:(2Fe-2S)-binding protein n=1 Tax=Amphibiibacter pelophylacis TaxID=1799477 RepID=A0ACC6P133_9BURK
MIVCVCHRVSDHTIRRCGREGGCFDTLQFEHGVATQCGQCACSARALLDEGRAEAGLCSSDHARAPAYPVIALRPALAA